MPTSEPIDLNKLRIGDVLECISVKGWRIERRQDGFYTVARPLGAWAGVYNLEAHAYFCDGSRGRDCKSTLYPSNWRLFDGYLGTIDETPKTILQQVAANACEIPTKLAAPQIDTAANLKRIDERAKEDLKRYAKTIGSVLRGPRGTVEGLAEHIMADGAPHSGDCVCVLCSLPRGGGWAQAELEGRIASMGREAHLSLMAVAAFALNGKRPNDRTGEIKIKAGDRIFETRTISYGRIRK